MAEWERPWPVDSVIRVRVRPLPKIAIYFFYKLRTKSPTKIGVSKTQQQMQLPQQRWKSITSIVGCHNKRCNRMARIVEDKAKKDNRNYLTRDK